MITNTNDITFNYPKCFTCDRTNVLYLFICSSCDCFYLVQKKDSKQKLRKHKSDIYHSNNNIYKHTSVTPQICTNRFFKYFRFYHVTDVVVEVILHQYHHDQTSSYVTSKGGVFTLFLGFFIPCLLGVYIPFCFLPLNLG